MERDRHESSLMRLKARKEAGHEQSSAGIIVRRGQDTNQLFYPACVAKARERLVVS